MTSWAQFRFTTSVAKMPPPKDPIKYEEWRRKNSEAHRNRPATPQQLESLSKGRSPEVRARVGEARRGIYPEGFRAKNEQLTEERGNSRDSTTIRYRAWREAVYARDNDMCQSCGKGPLVGRDRQAHHVVGWNESVELRFEVSNGSTLCRSCHRTIENALRRSQ